MKTFAKAFLVSLSFLFPTLSHAQSYPEKPIMLVVPYAAGGGTDILARHIAEGMSKRLGKNVLVENRPGAGTNLGANIVAKSAPDGYVLLLGDLALAANPSLFKEMPFKPTKDLTPVAMVATAPLVLVAAPQLKANSVKEFAALAKDKPGTLSFGTAGYGNPPHIAAEQFKSSAKLDLVQVPYKGVGPALVDVLAGRVALLFTGISSSKAFIDDGRVVALAVTGDKRAQALPSVPTMSEAGYPEITATSWWGVFGPAGLPENVVATLNDALEKTLTTPEIQARLTELNIDRAYGSPDALRERLRSETERWSVIIKNANISIQ